MQARYSAGVQGRFTSVDPLMASAHGTSPQTWNRYSYALNNPLRYSDPSGLGPGTTQDIARGKAVGNPHTSEEEIHRQYVLQAEAARAAGQEWLDATLRGNAAGAAGVSLSTESNGEPPKIYDVEVKSARIGTQSGETDGRRVVFNIDRDNSRVDDICVGGYFDVTLNLMLPTDATNLTDRKETIIGEGVGGRIPLGNRNTITMVSGSRVMDHNSTFDVRKGIIKFGDLVHASLGTSVQGTFSVHSGRVDGPPINTLDVYIEGKLKGGGIFRRTIPVSILCPSPN